MGRPRTCTCDKCPKCLRAAYMRKWYADLTPDQKKEWISARDTGAQKRSDAKRRGTLLRAASHKANSDRWRARHPERYKARTAVGNALRDKRLFRQPCVTCGLEKVQAHHEDYSRPLDVIWLCFTHHRQLHDERAAQGG